MRLVCQLRGESVPSSVLGDSSRIWARTRSGAYVAGVYLEGRGLDPFRITLRRC